MDRTDYERATRGSRRALVVAFASGLVAILGALAAAFLWRNPDVWERESDVEPIFRVQSRSMEPNFRGPRLYWNCPVCKNSFPTSLDLDVENNDSELIETDATSGATNVDSKSDQTPYLAEALKGVRFLSCPYCGFESVPAENPSFENGADVRARKKQDAFEQRDLASRLKRAWKRETDSKFREQEARENEVRPERWDVVIFQDRSGRLTLKRVVGLPGELVSFVQGDVLVDGRSPKRSLRRALATATPLRSVEYPRDDERLRVVHVVRIRQNDETISARAAISNELEIGRVGGANVAPVELARDFFFHFGWRADDGSTTRFSVLARRPNSALLLSFDESTNSAILRVKPLQNGVAESGRRFEDLTERDFANEIGRKKEIPYSLPRDPRFTVATLDGDLVFAVDGEEWARFEIGDLNSTEIAPVDEPFNVLGATARVSNPSLYRDLHYSNYGGAREPNSSETRAETLVGRATKLADDRYFVLGDNSPASADSRFDEMGTVPKDKILFIVEE